METRVDRLQELLVGRCLALEDRAASDVHGRNVTFKVQERAVEPRQPVAVGHLWILALAASCGLGGARQELCAASHKRRPRLASLFEVADRPAESPLPGAGVSGGPTCQVLSRATWLG